jgi:hypothetical protein
MKGTLTVLLAFLKCVKAFSSAQDQACALRAYPHHFTGDHRFCIGGCQHAKCKVQNIKRVIRSTFEMRRGNWKILQMKMVM